MAMSKVVEYRPEGTVFKSRSGSDICRLLFVYANDTFDYLKRISSNKLLLKYTKLHKFLNKIDSFLNI